MFRERKVVSIKLDLSLSFRNFICFIWPPIHWQRKKIRSWLFKRGSLNDFCNRPYWSDSISHVIHSCIKLWRLYEENANPFSLQVSLARFRDVLQPATTDVQTKFSYLSSLACKSTVKVNSGFKMWCFEIRNWNAGIYKKHKAILWKTHSSTSFEYPQNHCTVETALYYQLYVR